MKKSRAYEVKSFFTAENAEENDAERPQRRLTSTLCGFSACISSVFSALKFWIASNRFTTKVPSSSAMDYRPSTIDFKI